MFAIRFAILSSLFYALNVSMVPMVYSFGVSAFLFLFFRLWNYFSTISGCHKEFIFYLPT